MRPLDIICAAAMAIAPLAAEAQILQLPDAATRVADEAEALSSYRLPIGPWEDGDIQSIWAEGEMTQQAWQIRSDGLTTLQLLAPLREQLQESGFDILFECETESCGGFDFRYGTSVIPEPAMHVDLGDFRFLSAQRIGEGAPEYISLLVSKSSTRGYVQICRVGPVQDESKTLFVSTKSPLPEEALTDISFAGPISNELKVHGRAVLADLEFQTGSASLGEGDFPSLAELADYLKNNPGHVVTLVGHSDTEGSLDGNIALSRKRAQSVARRLVESFGVPQSQVNAQGVGYLAPLASNLTEDGRSTNRRVEVVLTSTQY